MFNLSTQEVVSSIENSPLVNLNGAFFQEYQNFFGSEYDLQVGKQQDYQKLPMQEHLNRVVLGQQSTEMRKIKVFFMNQKITESLAGKFGVPLTFNSVDYWIDGKGYYNYPHRDDASIRLHLQVYLSDDNQGTCLYSKDKKEVHTFPFRRNFGYALLNNENSWHGVPELQHDGRKSLYVRYS